MGAPPAAPGECWCVLGATVANILVTQHTPERQPLTSYSFIQHKAKNVHQLKRQRSVTPPGLCHAAPLSLCVGAVEMSLLSTIP